MTTLKINGIPVAVVSVEPTLEMREAHAEWNGTGNKYRAMLAAADPSLTAAVVELREACAAAAKTFRWYEELHAAKGPEHADKAARNRAEAEKLEAALARVEVSRG